MDSPNDPLAKQGKLIIFPGKAETIEQRVERLAVFNANLLLVAEACRDEISLLLDSIRSGGEE